MPRRYQSLHKSINSLTNELELHNPKEIRIQILDPMNDEIKFFVDGIEIEQEDLHRKLGSKYISADIDVMVSEWDREENGSG